MARKADRVRGRDGRGRGRAALPDRRRRRADPRAHGRRYARMDRHAERPRPARAARGRRLGSGQARRHFGPRAVRIRRIPLRARAHRRRAGLRSVRSGDLLRPRAHRPRAYARAARLRDVERAPGARDLPRDRALGAGRARLPAKALVAGNGQREHRRVLPQVGRRRRRAVVRRRACVPARARAAPRPVATRGDRAARPRGGDASGGAGPDPVRAPRPGVRSRLRAAGSRDDRAPLRRRGHPDERGLSPVRAPLRFAPDRHRGRPRALRVPHRGRAGRPAARRVHALPGAAARAEVEHRDRARRARRRGGAARTPRSRVFAQGRGTGLACVAARPDRRDECRRRRNRGAGRRERGRHDARRRVPVHDARRRDGR